MAAMLLFVAVSFGQVKQQTSPFDRYRQSTANELEFRKAKFDIAALRISLIPGSFLYHFTAPYVDGETAKGKLVIQVEVSSTELPSTVNGRKEAMMEAVNVARAGFSYAFGTAQSIQDFDHWTVIQFFDTAKVVDAAMTKDAKAVDPYIGVYENGQLILR